jgi:C4-dicarboxylate transporter DctM subunit
MEILSLFVVLFALLLIGVPIGFAIAGATAVAMYFFTNLDMVVIAQYSFSGINSFPVLAIPFFILAGIIMSQGGIAKRIVDFAYSLLGFVYGGLGAVAVFSSMIFAAISGSGMATTSAIGSMMIPEMKKKGYDVPYSTTLVCAAGLIGPIIPPSLSLILYGVVVSVSVADLFLAGLLPGILIGVVFIITNYIMCKRMKMGAPIKSEIAYGTPGEAMKAYIKNVVITFKDGIWALLSPIIILGGIYSGIFTPTESACVSVVYSLIVSKFIYKELDAKKFYRIFIDAAVLNGITSFLLSYSTVFSTYVTFAKIPQKICEWISSVTDNGIITLLLINIILLIIGCFVDTVPAVLIMAPILLPTALNIGLDPVHFGVIMAVNLAIGLITPPYGCNLFVGCAVAGIKMESMFKYLKVYLTAAIIALLIIAYFPPLSMVLLGK